MAEEAEDELSRARIEGKGEAAAQGTWRLARAAVDVAARQVAFRRATVETLERELADTPDA